jgi:hypothetical protein
MQRILLIVVVLLVVWRTLAAIGRRLSEKAPGADSFSRFSPEARRRRQQWTGGESGKAEELVECGDNRAYCSEDCRHQVRAASRNERN